MRIFQYFSWIDIWSVKHWLLYLKCYCYKYCFIQSGDESGIQEDHFWGNQCDLWRVKLVKIICDEIVKKKLFPISLTQTFFNLLEQIGSIFYLVFNWLEKVTKNISLDQHFSSQCFLLIPQKTTFGFLRFSGKSRGNIGMKWVKY